MDTAYKCEPKKCTLPNHPQMRLSRKKTSQRVTRGSQVEHGSVVEIRCTTRHELYLNDVIESFKTKCVFGNWSKLLPTCRPKACILPREDGVYSTTYDGKQATVEQGSRILHTGKVSLRCNDGYNTINKLGEHWYGKNDAPFTCNYGDWKGKYSCIAKLCSVPEVGKGSVIKDDSDGRLQHEDKVPHQMQITMTCDEKHDLFFASNNKAIDDFSNTCQLGNWTSAFFPECRPKNCPLEIKSGSVYIIQQDDGKVNITESTSVQHGKNVTLQCHDDYELSKSPDLSSVAVSCEYGEWKNPQNCKLRNCAFDTPEHGVVHVDKKRVQGQIDIREQAIVTCDEGYSLYYNGQSLKDYPTTCRRDGLTKQMPQCRENNCTEKLSAVEHATFISAIGLYFLPENASSIKSANSEIQLNCKEGFALKNHKKSTNLKCSAGKLTGALQCRPEKCPLPPKDHSRIITSRSSNDEITKKRQAHRSEVTVTCRPGYHWNVTSVTKSERQTMASTCRYGVWQPPLAECIPDQEVTEDSETAMTTKSTERATTEKPTTKTISPTAILVTTTLKTTPVTTTQSTTPSPTTKSTTTTSFTASTPTLSTLPKSAASITKDCTIPHDQRYTFSADEGSLFGGDTVSSGRSLRVACFVTNEYDVGDSLELNYDYDTINDTNDENYTTVTCTDGKLSHFDISCPDVEDSPNKCTDIQHGTVTSTGNALFRKYTITCDSGYSLNNRHKSETFECNKGNLTSKDYNYAAECKPDGCDIPSTLSSGMMVYDEEGVSLSGSSHVPSGDVVNIDCSQGQEPSARRVRCSVAAWSSVDGIKSEKNPNNGFPLCRTANCTSNCFEHGTCIKDNMCICDEGYKGSACDIAICPKQCTDNGGKCLNSNTCTCPAGRYGDTCENKYCETPATSADFAEQKELYRLGDKLMASCGRRPFEKLIGPPTIECRSNGSWSDTVHCQKVIGMHCLRSDECGNDVLQCVANKCSCRLGYRNIANDFCNRVLGGWCSTDDDCPLFLSECKSNRCACIPRAKEDQDICNKKVWYRIRVQTADWADGESEMQMEFKLVGPEGSISITNLTTDIQRKPAMFKPNAFQDFKMYLNYVGKVQNLHIMPRRNTGSFPLEFVTVHIPSTRECSIFNYIPVGNPDAVNRLPGEDCWMRSRTMVTRMYRYNVRWPTIDRSDMQAFNSRSSVDCRYQCLQALQKEKSFLCQSFVYYPESETCYILSKGIESRAFISYPDTTSETYFVRKSSRQLS